MTMVRTTIRRPRVGVDQSLTARQVGAAYGYPLEHYTGKGYTCGIIELGGGFGQADVAGYFAGLGLPVPFVTAVNVAGGFSESDGPDGADGEVLLDIEVAGAIAPGASFRVYFAPNTDAGFLAAIKQAVAECDVVSISWGGPESSWSASTIAEFDAVFAQAWKNGVTVFAAAGDSGADDGTGSPVVDFPASSPHVVGCGGTKLLLNPDGSRASEVVWDENDTQSATGGGVSKHFPGRQVPDVAGNADPVTGYQVRIDGGEYVVGGTSAVAPLYAGLWLLLSEALGERVGSRANVASLFHAHPEMFFDVTSGDNGAFRAGPGRDETTGFGVVDGGKLLTVLTGTVPAPGPTPGPVPPVTDIDAALAAVLEPWVKERHVGENHKVQIVAEQWLSARGAV